MSASESESADADTDTEQFEYYPQVTQHPTTIIEGEISDIVTGADIDSDVEDTGTSFGVVYEDPEVTAGTLWRNDSIPEGFVSVSEFNDALRAAINGTDIDYVRGQEVDDDFVERSRERVAEVRGEPDDWSDLSYEDERIQGSDYKVADPDDQEGGIQYDQNGDETGIDVGGGEFESQQVDAFDTDTIMVWYGGMAGQFVGRALDFNGMAFARYTNPDDGDLPYLVKGLFQVPLGWRGDADIDQYGGENVPTTDRSKLARSEDNGGLERPPRVARPPVLRDDIDGRTFVAIGRYEGGRMHEVHIGRALDSAEAYTDLAAAIRADEDVDDDYDAIDMKYDQSADERLTREFDNPAEVFALYTGEGWLDEPEETQGWGGGDSGGSFDTPDVDVDDEAVDHPTEQEVEFAQSISEKLAGTGVSPEDEVFPTDEGNVDLSGIVEHNEDNFQVSPDVDAIREEVYATTDHLSTDDL